MFARFRKSNPSLLGVISYLMQESSQHHVIVAGIGRKPAEHNGFVFHNGRLSLKPKKKAPSDIWDSFCEKYSLRSRSSYPELAETSYNHAITNRDASIVILTEFDPRGTYGDIGNLAIKVNQSGDAAKNRATSIGAVRSQLCVISTLPPTVKRRTEYEIKMDNLEVRKAIAEHVAKMTEQERKQKLEDTFHDRIHEHHGESFTSFEDLSEILSN